MPPPTMRTSQERGRAWPLPLAHSSWVACGTCRSPAASGSVMRGAGRFQKAIVPGDVARDAIEQETRPVESVEFARIDDQLRGHVQAPQGFVHLFSAEQRHIAVGLAAEK